MVITKSSTTLFKVAEWAVKRVGIERHKKRRKSFFFSRQAAESNEFHSSTKKVRVLRKDN